MRRHGGLGALFWQATFAARRSINNLLLVLVGMIRVPDTAQMPLRVVRKAAAGNGLRRKALAPVGVLCLPRPVGCSSIFDFFPDR
jgi:hypothetical protein